MIDDKTGPSRRGLLAAAALAACPAAGAWAQTEIYPTRPLRLIVPTAPGGPLDVLGRLVAERLGPALGQNMIVENKPGAALNIGANFVAKAPPDGYTLLLANDGPLAMNMSLVENMPFDPRQDFAPIALIATLPLVVVVGKGVDARSIDDFVQLAKSRPGAMNYAAGGSITQLAAEQFKQATGTDLVHVSYRGSGPAVISLLSGETHFMIDGLTSSISHIQAGTLRALAVTSPTRVPSLPDVPTIAEAGFPQLTVNAWFGMLAPSGTSPAIVTRLNRELRRAMDDPDLVSRLDALGLQPTMSSPSELAGHIVREIDRWAGVVQRANIKRAPT